MNKVRHLFLTGEVQTGKSTLITRLLLRVSHLRLGGFRTLTAPPADSNPACSVHILPVIGGSMNEENRIGVRLGAGQRIAYPEGFEGAGLVLLRDRDNRDLILMDELGTMEEDAPLFRQEVLRILDEETPVLGVLKKKETPFLQEIAARADVRVLEVTREKADALLRDAVNFLLQVVNKGS